MKLIASIIKNVKNLSLNMKIQQKILTIYLIGGLLPLLFLITYMMNGTKNIVIEQTKTSEKSELISVSDRMSEIMRIVTDVSLRMYFDEALEHIAFKHYSSYYDQVTDYSEYTNINDYMSYYYKEINNIRIYLENQTLSSNNRFYRVNEAIRQADWYQETLKANGNSIWNYIYDDINRKYFLCLTRLIKTTEKKDVGVLMIQVRDEMLESLINKKPYETAIIMNDSQFVISNRTDTDAQDILDIIKAYRDNGSERVIYRGEDCVLTLKDINYLKTKSTGTIISLQPYRTILAAANKKSREGFLFIIISVILSIVLILFFSHRFSIRVKLFQKQMHKAAKRTDLGNFNIPIKMEGKDEIGMLYDDLYTMIESIQKLYMAVYEEKLQKEKLNSRQKDVEFKMLASQINPHFLYNTLETIRMKARCNQEYEIEELVKMLAKIMRRNIEIGDKLVSLKSELEFVEYYLKIQKYRFGDKIKFTIDTFGDISPYKVIPLIIQPIVENAFVHGLELKEGTGEIYIYIEEKEQLVIHVIDNGVGIGEKKLQELRNKLNDMESLDKNNIGLSNVNLRIKLLYGEDYGIIINSRENIGTAVTILLPKRDTGIVTE